jgi:hypothetical protein
VAAVAWRMLEGAGPLTSLHNVKYHPEFDEISSCI